MTKPMLASPLAKGVINDWSDWVIEEKFDGHRLFVQVTASLVQAWTRPRKHAGDIDGKTMAKRELPLHLMEAISRLPVGIYDGELIGGDTSTDVTRVDLRGALRFVVFDIVERGGESIVGRAYDYRRGILEAIAARFIRGVVELTEARRVTSQADVTQFVEQVWARNGEGAILKRRGAPYQSGKRSVDWLKVKKLRTKVMTIVGFEPTRGTVMNRGPFASVVLEDVEGNRTTVKTRDDHELRCFEAEWKQVANGPREDHPALGRKLRIEYQDRTRDGGYRHPRWDRWEEE